MAADSNNIVPLRTKPVEPFSQRGTILKTLSILIEMAEEEGLNDTAILLGAAQQDVIDSLA